MILYPGWPPLIDLGAVHILRHLGPGGGGSRKDDEKLWCCLGGVGVWIKMMILSICTRLSAIIHKELI